MDEITNKDVGLKTERERTSPVSPKRPRTDWTVTNNHGRKMRFDFPELLTFHKTTVYPSSKNDNVALMYTAAETEGVQGEISYDQPQDAKLIVTTVAQTASHADNVLTGLSQVCFIAAERHLLCLGEDEQPPLTETDKLSSNPSVDDDDDAGGASAESHSPAGADTSSLPDCKRRGKSLEDEQDEPPGGRHPPAGDEDEEEDGRQIRGSVSQTRSDEEVTCHRSDCTYEDAPHDAGFCKTWNQSAEVTASNQMENQPGSSENILFNKDEDEEEDEGKSRMSLADYADSKSFNPNPEQHPPGNSAEGEQNEQKISELQINEDENGAVCDGETKGHTNENGMSKNLIPSVAVCAQGSTVSYDVALAESVRVEADDDLCGAKRERAAEACESEMANHTTETSTPVRISQEFAEGDNDPDPFSVIDPAIWSKAKEKHCNSNSDTTAGVVLLLSSTVKVCETETPHPHLFTDVRSSHEAAAPGQIKQVNHQSTTQTQQLRDEKEDLCQLHTAEPQACSSPINETHNMTGNESSCHCKHSPNPSSSSSITLPPAGDGPQESHCSVRHELKEQDQSDCFHVGLDKLNTQEAEDSQTETNRLVMTNPEIKERKDTISFVEDEKHRDHICDWTEQNVSECDNRSVVVENKEKERKDVEHVGEEIETNGQQNSEILVKTEEDLQQQTKIDRTDINKSENGDKISHEEPNNLSCFHDYQIRAETFLDENKDELFCITLPPISDAVVPCQDDRSHSQKNNHNHNPNPTALSCSDRFSSVPSAFAFCDRMPRGFDTFEKIQLLPDDDDDGNDDDDDEAVGLCCSPILTSSAEQLLETSEQQLHYDMIPVDEEEEEEGSECDTENMADEFLNSKKLPNCVSEADVVALDRPEKQPDCESACDSCDYIRYEFNPQSSSSAVCTESDSTSDANAHPQFEMKKQFDMVLKELSLFFEISASDFTRDSRESSPHRCRDSPEASNSKKHLSSPEVGQRDAPSDDADDDCSLEMCAGDLVVSRTVGSCDGEQEVPLNNHQQQEASMYAAEKHRDPRETEQRRKTWSPSFVCPPFLEQLSLRLPEPPRRLEPLRTCARPIRVGLSKRAKTKRLHRPHPYK